jgi:hypothetical protein
MAPKANKRIEPQEVVTDKEPVKSSGNPVGKTMKKVLGGSLLSMGTFKFFRYLLFLAFLAFIYIANNYYAERNIREINLLRKELKELRHEYIHTKTQLMEIEKQSQIAKKLEKKGIKKNKEPVKTIEVK